MQRTAQNWSVGDQVAATKLQGVNADLDRLFAELSNDNLSLTYDIQGQLSQVVDTENSVTINIDWSQWNSATVKLFIQKVGDLKKWTITYDGNGFPSTIVYA